MKTTFTVIALLIIGFSAPAQTYPCETSRIGKLVTKPLLKNGTIHYDLAVKDSVDPRARIGKDITTIVENPEGDGYTYIARHITLNDSSNIDLLFVSEKSGKCTYQITKLSRGNIYGIRLNENGDVIDWDEKTRNTKSMQKEQEKFAENWLKYF